jgi:hypothetical protein
MTKKVKVTTGATLFIMGLATFWSGMFLSAWILMLVVGALLGNEGLWTPAYWEVFGTLYASTTFVSFLARNAANTIDVQRSTRTKVQQPRKPII